MREDNGYLNQILSFFGALVLTLFALTSTPTVPTEVIVTPAALLPTLDIIYMPAEPATDAQLSAAQAILDERLRALTEAGQIATFMPVELTADGGLRVRVAEGDLDQGAIIDALRRSGLLEFVDLSSVSSSEAQAYTGQSILTSVGVERSGPASEGQAVFPTILTNDDVVEASASRVDTADGPANYLVLIELTPEAGIRLGDFTEAHIGAPIAIVLDGVVLMAPTIQARIESEIVLNGSFTEQEVELLAAQINTRALPFALTVESVTTIAR